MAILGVGAALVLRAALLRAAASLRTGGNSHHGYSSASMLHGAGLEKLISYSLHHQRNNHDCNRCYRKTGDRIAQVLMDS